MREYRVHPPPRPQTGLINPDYFHSLEREEGIHENPQTIPRKLSWDPADTFARDLPRMGPHCMPQKPEQSRGSSRGIHHGNDLNYRRLFRGIIVAGRAGGLAVCEMLESGF